jgi:hypothetical protein
MGNHAQDLELRLNADDAMRVRHRILSSSETWLDIRVDRHRTMSAGTKLLKPKPRTSA